MSALVIASGTELDKNFLLKLAQESELVICADGGVDRINGLNIIPDAILGDFDSADNNTIETYKKNCKEIIKFDEDKDYTDTELAINYAVNQGYSNIVLVCASGTRLDHTLANIMLLERYYEKGINIKIIDNNNEIILVEENKILKNKKNYFTSLIPVTKIVKGVTLKGFKFNLNNRDVNRGSTLCISNCIVDEYAEINIEEGCMLVFTSKD